ncbi:hypothetical protein LTR36_005641 [Oleoguttula mirabilis]|uniref:Uncharacterized protein n=1 Tax=Oleoguttula mirabilis TaxID=1507867 RepID=A0AAV9JER6_9PEZI|nr:hypothetical protein LTR36_005641 [Oleoguttula mirabilis]
MPVEQNDRARADHESIAKPTEDGHRQDPSGLSVAAQLQQETDVTEDWCDGESLPLVQVRRNAIPTTGSPGRQKHKSIQDCIDAQQSLLFCLPLETYLMITKRLIGSVRDVVHLHFAVQLVGGEERRWDIDWVRLAERHLDKLLDNIPLCKAIRMDGLANARFTPTNITPSIESGLRQDMTYSAIVRGLKADPHLVPVSRRVLDDLLAIDQKSHRRSLLHTSRTMREKKDIPMEDARVGLDLEDHDRRKYVEMLADPPLPEPLSKEHNALVQDKRIESLIWLLSKRRKEISVCRQSDEKARLLLNRQDLAFKAVFHRIVTQADEKLNTCMKCMTQANDNGDGRQLLSSNMGRPRYVSFCDDCLIEWCKSTRVNRSDFARLRVDLGGTSSDHRQLFHRWALTIEYCVGTGYRTQKIHTISRADADSIANEYAGVSWETLLLQLQDGQWTPPQLYNAARRYLICTKAVLRALNWYEGKSIDSSVVHWRNETDASQTLDGLLSNDFADAFKESHLIWIKAQSERDAAFNHIAALYDAEQPWSMEADMQMHEDMREMLSETWCDYAAADYWCRYIEVHLGRIPHTLLRRDFFIIADPTVEPDILTHNDPMDTYSCTITQANALCRTIHGCKLRGLDQLAVQTKARNLKRYLVCAASTKLTMEQYHASVTEAFDDLTSIIYDAPDARVGTSPLPGLGRPTVTTTKHTAALTLHIMRFYQQIVEVNPPVDNLTAKVFAIGDVPNGITKAFSKAFWNEYLVGEAFFDRLRAWMVGKEVWLVVENNPNGGNLSLPQCLSVAHVEHGLKVVYGHARGMRKFFVWRSVQLFGQEAVPGVCGRVVWFNDAIAESDEWSQSGVYSDVLGVAGDLYSR